MNQVDNQRDFIAGSNKRIATAVTNLQESDRGRQALTDLRAFLNSNQEGLDRLGARSVVTLVTEFFTNHRRGFLPANGTGGPVAGVPSDEQIIAECDPSVRHRRRIELLIVHKTIQTLKDAGFSLAVQDGETAQNDLKWDLTEQQLLVGSIFSVDESHLVVRKVTNERTISGWVLFVLGNSGYDVISDYTTNLEEALAPVNAYADKLEVEGH